MSHRASNASFLQIGGPRYCVPVVLMKHSNNYSHIRPLHIQNITSNVTSSVSQRISLCYHTAVTTAKCIPYIRNIYHSYMR